jgi:hypothetical protein
MALANSTNVHWPYYKIEGEFLHSLLPYSLNYNDVAPRVQDAFSEHPDILLGSFELPRGGDTFTLIFRSNMGDPAAETEAEEILGDILPGAFENIFRTITTTASFGAGATASVGGQLISATKQAADLTTKVAKSAPDTLRWATTLGLVGLAGWLLLGRR